MPFERPNLQTLIDRIDADLESRLSTSQLRRSNAKVYARVLAGVSHELHGFIEFLSRQLFFDTAEAEYLDRWASIYGLVRKPPSLASGTVVFTVLEEGATVPEGTLLQADHEAVYETTSAVSEGKASVRALTAGTAGNVSAGDTLVLVSPIEGISSECKTAEGISGGADEETDESLRARLLSRVREPPHAGTAADYKAWALEIEGVTRAWVYPLEGGPGTVAIRFVCDNSSDILPSAEMIKKVQAYIDSVRPVTANATVSAPTIQAIPFTISGLDPNNDTVKAAVKASLETLFRQEGGPGAVIYLSHIRAAISAAVGEADHTLVTPAGNIALGNKILPTVGEITWQ